jgi:subtilase family serine protease
MSTCLSLYASTLLATILLCLSIPMNAAETAAPRIIGPINESQLVQLTGNTHPLALPQFDRGPVPDDLLLPHMSVVLRRDDARETSLEQLIVSMHDPHSPNYRQWLTADQLGRNFGPAPQDIATVARWLSLHGFQVNSVHKAGLTIDVTGTAGQVRDTFHTEIHYFNVNGELHIANASDPEIPAALASVVVGISSLNDFMPKPVANKLPGFTFPCTGCPDGFNNTIQYDEAPADFATIYNVKPLYGGSHPITGHGQTVVVLEVTDVESSDVATFRSAFGLSSYSGTFTQIHPGPGCTDPGMNGAEGEAALDSEWAGAAAPDADVELASCANSATNFGAFIAAQNLLDEKTPPPIMSLSYGGCETAQGPSGNAYINAVWQQADAEGVSVFVSAGDGSAAGCDNFDTSQYATSGIAVNGLGSTIYNFSAGGTDFADSVDGLNSTYWKTTNSSSRESAKSYVPEMTWNDSCAGSVLYRYLGYTNGVSFCNSTTGEGFLNIVGGSGGPSFAHDKPSWQAQILGNPTDGKRDLPDVSLFASNGFWNHAVVFCMSDANEGGAPCDYNDPVDVFFNSAGGTSFSAPQFASIQALINQSAGGPQGNPAPAYYALAAIEYGSPRHPNTGALEACNANNGRTIASACFFHDVTRGNNDVPCYGTDDCYLPEGEDYGVLSTSDTSLQVAYPAHPGWDFATGLGTPNVTNVVKSWP